MPFDSHSSLAAHRNSPGTRRSTLPCCSGTVPRALWAALAVGLLLLGTPLAADDDTDRAERDRRFAELLEGARMEGKFNLESAQGESPAQADLYSVSKLVRGEDDTWIFEYSMSYGQGPDGPKATVPIPVTVEWAGDTPVLTMTEQTIEGLGTFTVRVMIYGERYAGTWQNGPVGGHMWGRIVRDDDGVSADE